MLSLSLISVQNLCGLVVNNASDVDETCRGIDRLPSSADIVACFTINPGPCGSALTRLRGPQSSSQALAALYCVMVHGLGIKARSQYHTNNATIISGPPTTLYLTIRTAFPAIPISLTLTTHRSDTHTRSRIGHRRVSRFIAIVFRVLLIWNESRPRSRGMRTFLRRCDPRNPLYSGRRPCSGNSTPRLVCGVILPLGVGVRVVLCMEVVGHRERAEEDTRGHTRTASDILHGAVQAGTSLFSVTKEFLDAIVLFIGRTCSKDQ